MRITLPRNANGVENPSGESMWSYYGAQAPTASNQSRFATVCYPETGEKLFTLLNHTDDNGIPRIFIYRNRNNAP